MQPFKGALDLFESAAPVSDAGTVRIACKGGEFQVSANGGAFAAPAPGADSVTTAMIQDSAVTYAKIDRDAQETIVTLGSANQDINVTGLAGDTDGDYLIYAHLIFAQSGTCVIQPNGSDPVVASSNDWVVNGTGDGASNSPSATVKIAQCGTAATIDLVASLTSKSGRARFGNSQCIFENGVMATVNFYLGDTATVLTSLKFHGSAATIFSTGSYVRLIKLGHTK